MPLIAKLFASARTLKPSTHTPPASSSSTSDNSPSFNDALDSALQPQRSPAPTSPTATAAKPETKLACPEKKNDQTDDASGNQPAVTDDSITSDASIAQTPATTVQPVQPFPSEKPVAKDGQKSDDQPADPTALQIAVVVAQPQPLPITHHQLIVPTDVNYPPARMLAAQPVQAVAPTPQNIGTEQPTPAKPVAPAQQADAPQTTPTAITAPPPPAPVQTAESPAPPLKQVLKRPTPSPTPAAATPAKKTEITPSAAALTNDQTAVTSPENDAPTPSPLAAQHTNTKLATDIPRSVQSPDSPTSQASTSTPTQSPSITPDATLIAESIKSLTPAPIADVATPAAPQSSATPIHTLTTSSNHPIDNSATPAAPAQDSPRAEPDLPFDQIVLGLRTKMDATHSRAEISLNPPNLGTLHVSVSLQNGSLTAQFQSSSEVVRDLLKGNMEKLKSVLESQGVTVDNLAVGAPQDKTELPSAAPATAQTNQSANDGRSAGQYNQEPQNRKRSQDPGAFAKSWQHANAKAPIDLVA